MGCNKCSQGNNRCNTPCSCSKTKCDPLRYKGGDIDCIGISCGDSFESIVQKISESLCNLPFKDGNYVEVNEEPAGENCENGGLQVIVRSGEDDSILSTDYICRGAEGCCYELVTHAELVTLIDNEELEEGANYLITDFQTIYIQPAPNEVKFAEINGEPFIEPLLVQATSNSTISHEAKSILFPDDTIEYLHEPEELLTSGTFTKGKIIRRRDRVGNDIPFDFRTVKFKRYETSPGSGNFHSYINNGNNVQEFYLYSLYDPSTPYAYEQRFNDNVMAHHDNPSNNTTFYNIWRINSVFFGNSNQFITGNKIGKSFRDNTILQSCIGNTFGEAFTMNLISFLDSNIFGEYCEENNFSSGIDNCIIGGYFYRNQGEGLSSSRTGEWCHDNDFGQTYGARTGTDFYNNVIQRSVYDTFGNNFNNNTFSNFNIENGVVGTTPFNNFNNSESNVFGDNVSNNTFGFNFQNNKIGDYNQNNTYSDFFYANKIGVDTYSNIFHSNCVYNNTGNMFTNNVLGNGFSYNKIGNQFRRNSNVGINFQHNQIGDHFMDNLEIGEGFQSNEINNFYTDNEVGDFFINNIIGNYFQNNTIGDFFGGDDKGQLKGNIIGDACLNNIFGDIFQGNKIGVGFFGNTFQGSAVEYNDFGNDFHNSNVAETSGASSFVSNSFKNDTTGTFNWGFGRNIILGNKITFINMLPSFNNNIVKVSTSSLKTVITEVENDIVVETFNSGIPVGWQNLDKNSAGYSWEATGVFSTGIDSTTKADGWLLLNSGDNNVNPIDEIDLITSTIDLSGKTGQIFFSIEQFISAVEDLTARIIISNDDFSTDNTVLYTFSSTGGQTVNPLVSLFDISAYAGESNVKIKFEWIGKWEDWWQIDDFRVYELEEIVSIEPDDRYILDFTGSTSSSLVYNTFGSTIPYFTKEIIARQDGTPRLKYMDNTDAIVVVDITD